MGSLSLPRKILLLALLHLVILAGVVVGFARSQFGFGPESLIAGPSRDRILAIANSFSVDFEARSAAAQESLFEAYSAKYKATFYLTDPQGRAIAGPSITVPDAVLKEIRRGHGPPRAGDGPPPDRPPPPAREEAEDYNREQRPLPEPPPIGAGSDVVFLVITHDPTSYWAGARIPISRSRETPRAPAVLLLRSDSLLATDLFFDWRLWLGVALSVGLASGLCWIPFIRGLTRSIARMDQVTGQIADGRFDVQVSDQRSDELGHLGRQINSMALRLQTIVGNQKRFLGDIAHELCAPIARIQFALGILEQKVDPAQQYHVAILHEEIQEMSALVNELLSFSKATLLPGDSPLLPVPLALLAQRAISRESPRGGQVVLAINERLAVLANESLLLRALSNILRNAIRYAGDAGPIEIAARENGNHVFLTVSDHGGGLPESELEQIFEPFYRPEASRTRETGGAGLGLAIVRTCIEACHGTVGCSNRKPAGLEVTIRLAAATAVSAQNL